MFKKIKLEKINEPTAESFLPNVNFTEKELPAIKNWKVGGEYEITLKVRQTSMTKDRDMPISARFEITAVEVKNELDDDQKEMMNKMTKKKIREGEYE